MWGKGLNKRKNAEKKAGLGGGELWAGKREGRKKVVAGAPKNQAPRTSHGGRGATRHETIHEGKFVGKIRHGETGLPFKSRGITCKSRHELETPTGEKSIPRREGRPQVRARKTKNKERARETKAGVRTREGGKANPRMELNDESRKGKNSKKRKGGMVKGENPTTVCGDSLH